MVSFAVATATALSCPTCKFAPHAELLPRNALALTKPRISHILNSIS
jgi:hypothetical protein